MSNNQTKEELLARIKELESERKLTKSFRRKFAEVYLSPIKLIAGADTYYKELLDGNYRVDFMDVLMATIAWLGCLLVISGFLSLFYIAFIPMVGILLSVGVIVGLGYVLLKYIRSGLGEQDD